MSKRTVLVNHERIVVHAETVGFYYNFGKRQKSCNHGTCGYVRTDRRKCYYMSFLEPENADSYYKAHYTTLIKTHKKKECKVDWCIIENGPRPAAWPKRKPNPCKKTYFRRYTDQQLANPATKVELVAISLSVAEDYRLPRANLVCVYDLMNDGWYTTKWWKTTPKGDLTHFQDYGLDYGPSAIDGIDEVITKVKASL